MKTLVISTESVNTSTVPLRGTHAVAQDGRPKPGTKGLRRQDLTPEIIARFHAKYKAGVGCWEWQAARYSKGYGQFVLPRVDGCQPHVYAHRVAYALAKGDVPAGLVVMHSCDNPCCVNPAHLSLGTHSDNLKDAAMKRRLPRSRPWLQKITDDQVREIRASLESSVSLARRFGVTLAAISQIRRGLRRKAA